MALKPRPPTDAPPIRTWEHWSDGVSDALVAADAADKSNAAGMMRCCTFEAADWLAAVATYTGHLRQKAGEAAA